MSLLFYLILNTQLYTPPLEPKVSPVFSEWLSAKPQDSKVKIWVFFTDKGIKEETKYKKAITEVEASLLPAARKNRLTVRKPGMLCDFTDIPVYKPYIDELKTMGANLNVTSKWLNASTVIVPVKLVSEIAQRSYVYRIEPVRTLRSTTEIFVPRTRARKGGIDYGSSKQQLEQLNLTSAHNSGFTGDGVIIGILDTGFDWRINTILGDSTSHIKVIAEHDFIGKDDTTSHQQNQVDTIWDGSGGIELHPELDDFKQIEHGTAMLSLLGGRSSDRCIGAAFAASFALAKTELLFTNKVGCDFLCEEDWWIQGAEWLDSIGVSIISSSLGYKRWTTVNGSELSPYGYRSLDGKHNPLDLCASGLWSKGILLVTAMGNYDYSEEAPDTSIISPASADSILAVGGVDTLGKWVGIDYASGTGSIIGPRCDAAMKPEVCGPWLGNYSMPASSTYPAYDSIVDYVGHGTSDATALVAGACACIKQAHPDWGPMKLRDAIMKTASKAKSPNDTLGYGIVNAYSAINYETPIFPRMPYNRNRILVLSPAPFILSKGGKFVIYYQIINSTYPQVYIYTLSGKLIWSEDIGQKIMGRYTLEWDGKTNNGDKVGSGVYLCVLTSTNGDNDTRKFVVIR